MPDGWDKVSLAPGNDVLSCAQNLGRRVDALMLFIHHAAFVNLVGSRFEEEQFDRPLVEMSNFVSMQRSEPLNPIQIVHTFHLKQTPIHHLEPLRLNLLRAVSITQALSVRLPPLSMAKRSLR